MLMIREFRLFIPVVHGLEDRGQKNEDVCGERANPSYRVFLNPPKCQNMEKTFLFKNGCAFLCVQLL